MSISRRVRRLFTAGVGAAALAIVATAGPAHASPWTVDLSVGTSPTWYYFTATTNQDVGPTVYWIEIYESTNGGPGSLVANCGAGFTCQYQWCSPVDATYAFTAFVAPYNTNEPPPGAVAESATITTNHLCAN